MTVRPFRSALYIPGSKDRALDKARSLPVDCILFDLEDAVAPDEKINARKILAAALSQGGYGQRYKVVRINATDTPWGRDDAVAVADMSCDAVLLPKVNGPADIDSLTAVIGAKPVWAMIETPLAILNASAIAAHPSVEGFVLGTNDLAKDLNTRPVAHREPLLYALQAALMAAKAHGVIAIDGVYNAFKDDEGLRIECEQGRTMGYDGKSLIHPAQVDIANAAFSPGDADIELAKRQIEAFNAAKQAGSGVAVVDGKIVENLHIVTARATLAKAKIIQDMTR